MTEEITEIEEIAYEYETTKIVTKKLSNLTSRVIVAIFDKMPVTDKVEFELEIIIKTLDVLVEKTGNNDIHRTRCELVILKEDMKSDKYKPHTLNKKRESILSKKENKGPCLSIT